MKLKPVNKMSFKGVAIVKGSCRDLPEVNKFILKNTDSFESLLIETDLNSGFHTYVITTGKDVQNLNRYITALSTAKEKNLSVPDIWTFLTKPQETLEASAVLKAMKIKSGEGSFDAAKLVIREAAIAKKPQRAFSALRRAASIIVHSVQSIC